MSAQRKINTTRYDFEIAREKIDNYIMASKDGGLIVAWLKAQLIIEAQARFYGLQEYDEDTALALAWEDFDIACRARGEPGVTGAVFMLWSRLPKSKDKEFREVLQGAFVQAQYQTDSRLFRYPERARLARVQTLEDGFDDGEATPMDFRAIQEWIKKKDAEAVPAKPVAPKPKLTIVEAGLKEEPKPKTKPKSEPEPDDVF
jgi:hypothetical protein